jgi:XTP/dITP diphosphohydrolase
MERLLELMRTLRGPEGCPWDRQQTHGSLRPYLLEEAAEAVEALTEGGRDEVVEELGDVLLQVAFHAVIAEGDGRFDYDDIEEAIADKLIRRHPHVFGDVRADDAAAVVATWRAAKAAEGRPEGRVPPDLPTLMRASALAEAHGWSPDPAASDRTLDRALVDHEALGRTLLDLVLLARGAGLDPEMALRDAVAEAASG